MLSKSIKHEFRATSRVMLPMMLALLALSVVTHFAPIILDSGEVHWLLSLFAVLVLIAFFVGLVVVSVGTIVVMVSRFQRSFFSDEGYLNMTLPVNTHTHISSRLIVSFIWDFFAAIAIILSVMLAFMNGENWLSFFGTFGQVFADLIRCLQNLQGREIWDLILLCLEFLLGLILAQVFGALLLYAAISLGYSFNKHKKGLAVLFGIAFYQLTQLLATVSVVLVVEASPFNFDNVTAMTAVSSLEALMGFGIFLELIGCAVFYWVTYFCMGKKLNLD